jgi:hypothetical protein
MSAHDPELLARLLADPALAALCRERGVSALDPATLVRVMGDPAFALLCRAPWMPDPLNAPQMQAYTSPADLLLYGGAAGGGKSDLLLGLATTAHERSVIFRRTYEDLRGMEQRLMRMPGIRAGYSTSAMTWRHGRRILEFGALERPEAVLSWHGRAHDFIGFDEGAQLAEDNVRIAMAWLRSDTPGQRCRAVIASNPPIGGQGQWLLVWFAPWLDPAFPDPAKPLELRWCCTRDNGTIAWVDGPGTHLIDGKRLVALSCTFVPARLEDNRFLSEDYRAQLMRLPEPMRSKLLHGDFLSGRADAAQQVMPWSWIEAAQKNWTPDGARGLKMTTLGIDVAQGGADATVLAALYGGTWFAPLVRRKGIDTTNGPAVAALAIETMRDGCQINIDLTGGWGGSARDHLVAQGIRVEPVVFSQASPERTRDGQLTFANKRSELTWKFREALDPVMGEGIALPPDPRLAAQLAAPTWKLRGNAILIESKDDIRKRLGTSTDDADAVILAWHQRDDALRRQTGPKLNPGRYLGQGGWMGV